MYNINENNIRGKLSLDNIGYFNESVRNILDIEECDEPFVN